MSNIDLTTFFITASLLCAMLGQCHSAGHQVEDLNEASSAQRERLATGVWGGEHVRLEVTDGGGRLEFDCASGMIDRPIILDSQGHFDVAGQYVREHAGPVRRDEENTGRAAHYTGRVREKALTLTVTLKEPEEIIGTFNLMQGSLGRVMKCR